MTPEIDKIINSIENRNHRTAFQQRFKMGAWNAAISFAYLAKRLTDIFISSAAIIALPEEVGVPRLAVPWADRGSVRPYTYTKPKKKGNLIFQAKLQFLPLCATS